MRSPSTCGNNTRSLHLLLAAVDPKNENDHSTISLLPSIQPHASSHLHQCQPLAVAPSAHLKSNRTLIPICPVVLRTDPVTMKMTTPTIPLPMATVLLALSRPRTRACLGRLTRIGPMKMKGTRPRLQMRCQRIYCRIMCLLQIWFSGAHQRW